MIAYSHGFQDISFMIFSGHLSLESLFKRDLWFRGLGFRGLGFIYVKRVESDNIWGLSLYIYMCISTQKGGYMGMCMHTCRHG